MSGIFLRPTALAQSFRQTLRQFGATQVGATQVGATHLGSPQVRQVRLRHLDRVALAVATLFVVQALVDGTAVATTASNLAQSLVSTAPYIVFAVLFIAYVKTSGATLLIARAMQGRTVQMIFVAALFGGLAPLCSCEVVPLVAALLAAGAPLPAVMAFWLASPLVDPAGLALTLAALGPVFAVAQTVAAVALGLLGGFTLLALSRTRLTHNPLRQVTTSSCCDTTALCAPAPDLSTEATCTPDMNAPIVWRFWSDRGLRKNFRTELRGNGWFLLKWLTLAYTLKSLMESYVPAEWITSAVGGDGFAAIFLGALVGAPAYLSSYAAPALVSGLVEQGMAQGAALAFMVAGAIFSVPSALAVFALVRVRVGVFYLVAGFTGALLAGFAYASFLALIS